MSTFKFSLQRVLDVRYAAERKALVAHAERMRRCAGIESKLRGVGRAIDIEREALRAMVGGRVDMRGARLQAAAAVRLRASADALAQELAQAYLLADRTRAALARALADRRAVELLRDRRLEAWKAEQAKAEARELDDVTVAMLAREAQA